MPDPIQAPRSRTRPLWGLALAAAGLALALAPTPEAPAAAPQPPGPAKLAVLLARYDQMPAGPARDAFAREIDTFAGQRYATVSRLYWYRDLAEAKAVAAAQHRPILHLRMLGRLDEDLSCANSRFFRTILYANAETAAYLRDHFVLAWSSERPVPRVTIDFGDGRKLVRTTTGNSAHYVMDARGNVLDVLPGLYAPAVFRAELTKSFALAWKVRGLEGAALVDAVVAHHQAEARRAAEQLGAIANTPYIVRAGRLLDGTEIGATAVARAQRATFAKMATEAVDLRRIGIDAGAIDPADVSQWATIGQQLWNIGLAAPEDGRLRRADVPPPQLLDAQSIALIDRVRAGNPQPMERARLLARLEQHVLADTALDELRIRPQIRRELVRLRSLDFATLNDAVYARVFHTPKDDAWLGLLDGTDFTGLPADGVVRP